VIVKIKISKIVVCLWVISVVYGLWCCVWLVCRGVVFVGEVGGVMCLMLGVVFVWVGTVRCECETLYLESVWSGL